MKEATVPGGDIISVIGSTALGTIATDNKVTQSGLVVNIHSMQDGGGVVKTRETLNIRIGK